MSRTSILSAVAAVFSALTLSACGESNTPSAAATLAGSGSISPSLVQDRFLVTESAVAHDATLSALLTALDRRDLTVFAVIDHAAGAEGVGLELPKSTLVIFGNPKAGTPLMQAEPLLGAELPLRALVYERGERTYLAVTGMSYLDRSYNLQNRAAVVDKVTDTLSAIANEATTFNG